MGKQDTEKQWKTLIQYIEKHIESPRKEKLISMYEKLSERVLTAPASSHFDRHNCFPGGYIDHVNRVVECAINLYVTWKTLGADMSTYTLEEVVFSAINHDLGKVGSKTEEYYIPNDSKWHVERGQYYKINPKLNFMKVPDRSLHTLQEFGIQVSENEFLAIKLHDGLYSKGNESYLMAGSTDFSLKTDLPILVHHADHLATLIESAIKRKPEEVIVETKPKSKMSSVNNPAVDDSLKNAFDQIFGA